MASSIYTITGLGGAGVARATWESNGEDVRLLLKGAPSSLASGVYEINIVSSRSGNTYKGVINLGAAVDKPPSFRPPTPIPQQHLMTREDGDYAIAFMTYMSADGYHRVSPHLCYLRV